MIKNLIRGQVAVFSAVLCLSAGVASAAGTDAHAAVLAKKQQANGCQVANHPAGRSAVASPAGGVPTLGFLPNQDVVCEGPPPSPA